jgi:hypothetical protein
MSIMTRFKLKPSHLLVLLAFSAVLAHAPTAFADTPSQGPYTTTVCGAPAATANGFVPLACYNGSPAFQNAFNNTGGLPAYLNDVFTIVISIGGILAVLRIAYAGYLYMGSADMWSNVQHAKEVLSDAIIGLLLLFAIYLILNQIDPSLLNLGVLNDIQQVQTAPQATQTGANGSLSANAAGGPY